MKSDVASEVELLAEVMKGELWGRILKLPPQYRRSLSDNSINSTGTTVLGDVVSSCR